MSRVALHTFEEGLGLLVEQVETVPGALQAEVAAHYSDVVRHYLAHLLDALGDEHFLLVGHSSLVVPFRHIGVERVRVDSLERMAGCSVGIDDSLDERVAGQTVTAMSPVHEHSPTA